MDVHVTVSGPDAADELLSLYRWLADDEELAGRARVAGASAVGANGPGAAAGAGTLGPVTDSVAVLLGQGGLAAALATGLVAWLRQRSADVTVRVRRPDGQSIEVAAKRVRGLDTAELRALADHLASELTGPELDSGRETGPR